MKITRECQKLHNLTENDQIFRQKLHNFTQKDQIFRQKLAREIHKQQTQDSPLSEKHK